jgi:hypothetical protein
MHFSISRANGLPNRFRAAEACQISSATDTQGRGPKDIRCPWADAAGCRGRRATPATFAVQEAEANAKMVNGFEGTNGAFALHDQMYRRRPYTSGAQRVARAIGEPG